MKILFIGDISGKPGREIIKEVLPEIKKKEGVDYVIANCENSAGGRGVTKAILSELQAYGIDFFTSGEHVWDQREFFEDLYDTNLPITRPFNYEKSELIPGKGYDFIDLGKQTLLIINLLGQTFMREFVRNPFWAFDDLWKKISKDPRFNSEVLTIVDFHAETTSEKLSLGWYVKDRVNLFVGTHTHVPTADARIVEEMGYVTDVGMCGPYNASLWVNFEDVIHNFKYPFKQSFTMKEDGKRVFNSVLAEFDGKKVVSIKRVDRIV